MATNLLAQVLAESMERGLEQGLERGREEGREEARGLLRHFLERRFGVIPDPLAERIAHADAATLTALLDRALAVESIEAL